jgi:hypothetical protein
MLSYRTGHLTPFINDANHIWCRLTLNRWPKSFSSFLGKRDMNFLLKLEFANRILLSKLDFFSIITLICLKSCENSRFSSNVKLSKTFIFQLIVVLWLLLTSYEAFEEN